MESPTEPGYDDGGTLSTEQTEEVRVRTYADPERPGHVRFVLGGLDPSTHHDWHPIGPRAPGKSWGECTDDERAALLAAFNFGDDDE